MFTITNIKSALLSTVLMAIVGMAVYVIGLGDVFLIELKPLVNVGAIALLTGIVSVIKSLLTSYDTGKAVGVQVIDQ